MLTQRLTWLAVPFFMLPSGCSTALLIDSPYDEDEEMDRDAGAFDAGGPVDASVILDARADAGRDAAVDAGRDAAADAGRPHDCAVELPTRGYASLLTGGCAMRPTTSCIGQATLDSYLDRAARSCGLPQSGRPADLGFTFGSDGCPTEFRFEQEFVRGMISACIQARLEQARFECWSTQCAVVRVR